MLTISERSEMSRLYIYKMTNDGGGAPCVHKGVLSLAICKPQIRSSAKVGDWVIGIGGKELGGKLIYIAEVTKCEGGLSYYRKTEYTDRPDCIYELAANGAVEWREDSIYHPDGHWMDRDIGATPGYEKANVLLSSNFTYFGRNSIEIPKSYKEAHKLLGSLTQGHRVNLSAEALRDFQKLRDEVWSKYKRGKLGDPFHADLSKSCSDDEGSAE